ncbi:MAG: Gfo/Idh/MocA family oxidoreductase [Nibricoccus sp.]
MLNIGIVGLDSSHSVSFSRYFNADEGRAFGRVVAAWPGGSSDVGLSANRVEAFTAQVRDSYQVEIVPRIAEVTAKCDAVLLLSMDGRRHAAQFAEIVERGCPVYINKPLATSSSDARAIAALATWRHVNWFSASMLRCVDLGPGKCSRAEVTCPLWFDDSNPGWFWYGIHGIELLYAAMGSGVASVSVRSVRERELLVARWHDGRSGIVRGMLKKDVSYSISLDGGPTQIVPLPMRRVEEATARFLSGEAAPVRNEETLEIIRCIEAANESRARSGREVAL